MISSSSLPLSKMRHFLVVLSVLLMTVVPALLLTRADNAPGADASRMMTDLAAVLFFVGARLAIGEREHACGRTSDTRVVAWLSSLLALFAATMLGYDFIGHMSNG